ncbi:MAG: UDP-galactopyranose mutase [Vampirovibrionia bacterium]
MNYKDAKYLIVGAGFFGAVIAERIANDLNEKVIVIDKRSHIGGNSYTEVDSDSGIEVHKYGSHIFHTSDKAVWNYINKFCSFNNYRHKVLTEYKNAIYQMPINLNTINSFYGVNLKPYEVEGFLKKEIAKELIVNPSNLEEKAISLIGRPLYEAFIKGYTKKQWNLDPKDLPESIITRLPVRYDHNYFYFSDEWEGIPKEGYTHIFKALLDNKNIDLKLDTDYFDIKDLINKDCLLIYTGAIDQLFDYKYGQLGWRTLRFETEVINVKDFQGTTVVNYADAKVPYTRIHEFRHFHDERNYPDDKTVIYKEFSLNLNNDFSEPFYPINTKKDKDILDQYLNEVKKHPDIILGGRLGTYKYLNMDTVIAEALTTYEEKIKNR